jgi:hypothetical protein
MRARKKIIQIYIKTQIILLLINKIYLVKINKNKIYLYKFYSSSKQMILLVLHNKRILPIYMYKNYRIIFKIVPILVTILLYLYWIQWIINNLYHIIPIVLSNQMLQEENR